MQEQFDYGHRGRQDPFLVDYHRFRKYGVGVTKVYSMFLNRDVTNTILGLKIKKFVEARLRLRFTAQADTETN